jgi:hypothetical protein
MALHPKRPSDVSDTLELLLDNNPTLQTLEVGDIVVRDLPIVATARVGNLRILKCREFAEIKEAQRSRKTSNASFSKTVWQHCLKKILTANFHFQPSL